MVNTKVGTPRGRVGTRAGAALVVLGLGLLAGCSSTPAAPSTPSDSSSTDTTSSAPEPEGLAVLGYSVLGKGGAHWIRMIEEVTKAAEPEGIEVRISDPQFDAVVQVDQVQDLVTAGAQVVAIAALDQNAIEAAVQFAHDNGVKVISDISGFAGADAYVGINECERGKRVGEAVGAWWAENKADVAPKIFESNADSLGGGLPDRTDCMFDAIKAAVPSAELVADLEAWQEVDGYDAMSDVLASHPEVNLVLGSNNEGSWGHISASEAQGRKPGEDIFFATVDGQPRMLDLIKEGKVLVGDRVPEEISGPLLVSTAIGLFEGTIESGAEFFVDTSVITLDNVDAEIAAVEAAS